MSWEICELLKGPGTQSLINRLDHSLSASTTLIVVGPTEIKCAVKNWAEVSKQRIKVKLEIIFCGSSDNICYKMQNVYYFLKYSYLHFMILLI